MGSSNSHEALSIADAKQKLELFGICFIPNILKDTECFDYISGTWDYIEHVTNNRVKRDDHKTWHKINKLLKPVNNKIHHNSAGHSQHMWDLRQNESILNVYKKLYKTEISNLVTSYDSFSIGLRIENEDFEYVTRVYCDSHERDFGEYCSVYTPYGLDSDQFLYFEDSMLKYDELKEKFKTDMNINEYNEITNRKFIEYCKKTFKMKVLTCPKNSLIIWSKKLIRLLNFKKFKSTHMFGYISYGLKLNLTTTNIEERKEYLENMVTTNSSCYDPITYRYNDSSLKEIPYPKLSYVGMIMCCYAIDEMEKYRDLKN